MQFGKKRASHPGQERASVRKRKKQAERREEAEELGFASVFEMRIFQEEERQRQAAEQAIALRAAEKERRRREEEDWQAQRRQQEQARVDRHRLGY